MRIIAGEFRGRRLSAPKGQGTRPTTDRVRESLMSAIGSARGGFEGAVVLDAFAGSGALGLEALSRGAACAHFCERDGAALRVLSDNISLLKLDAKKARVHKGDVLKDTPLYARPPYDLIFLDPPYALDAESVFDLLERLYRSKAAASCALVCYEHDIASNGAVDELLEARGMQLRARKKYGDTVIDIIVKSEEEQCS